MFNAYSPQPQRTGVIRYTHLFTPNLVNPFHPGGSWYSSIFEALNYARCSSRKVTQWQINDNLTWTHSKQAYHFGINTRRVDTSDYDLGEGLVPIVTYDTLAEFTYGAAYTASRSFPVSFKERAVVGNLEYYAMETYKTAPKATVTYGMRVIGIRT